MSKQTDFVRYFRHPYIRTPFIRWPRVLSCKTDKSSSKVALKLGYIVPLGRGTNFHAYIIQHVRTAVLYVYKIHAFVFVNER
jgi:hypothetical protein